MSIFSDGIAYAQQQPFAPPVIVPYGRRMIGGFAYIQAGVRFRNLQCFRFNLIPHFIRYVDPGLPPFGPFGSGEFGSGVGRPGYNGGTFTNREGGFPQTPSYAVADAPRRSGFWNYDDGYIQAANGGAVVNSSPPPVFLLIGSDWPHATGVFEQLLGRASSSPSALAAGEFQMLNPPNQLDGTTFGSSDTVSFEYSIDGNYDSENNLAVSSGEQASLIIDASGGVFNDAEYADKIWTPSIELGYQVGNFFELFYGFSTFSRSHSVSRRFNVSGTASRLGIRDTYPFFSNVATMAGTVFNTTSTQAGSSGLNNYVSLYPDAEGINNSYPTRTFIQLDDSGLPAENLQEDISHFAAVTVYENRLGVRSWLPLYGWGKMGVALGALWSPIWFEINGTRRVVSLGPTAPGLVIQAASPTRHEDLWLNYGLFTAVDMTIEYGRYYFETAAEFNWCNDEHYILYAVETQFNPGGFSLNMAGGIRF
ncbi:hypothetical protein ACFL2Q_05830 [Thermodesulfobacteriota bacterium]